MKKRAPLRLRIDREIIRALEPRDLVRVAGAGDTDLFACTHPPQLAAATALTCPTVG